jgi:hypothetical protein
MTTQQQIEQEHADRLALALDDYMAELSALDKQRDDELAALERPAEWPLWEPELGKPFYVSGDGVTISGFVSRVDTAYLSGTTATGNVFPTRYAAEQHRDQRLAEMRVVRRIAEINAQEGWVADWGGGLREYTWHLLYNHEGGGAKCYTSFASASQAAPAHWYGCKLAIETVIEELPDDIRTMLGVE